MQQWLPVPGAETGGMEISPALPTNFMLCSLEPNAKNIPIFCTNEREIQAGLRVLLGPAEKGNLEMSSGAFTDRQSQGRDDFGLAPSTVRLLAPRRASGGGVLRPPGENEPSSCRPALFSEMAIKKSGDFFESLFAFGCGRVSIILSVSHSLEDLQYGLHAG
jgi:hypothetical protein